MIKMFYGDEMVVIVITDYGYILIMVIVVIKVGGGGGDNCGMVMAAVATRMVADTVLVVTVEVLAAR
jgi:hypothetical protein